MNLSAQASKPNSLCWRMGFFCLFGLVLWLALAPLSVAENLSVRVKFSENKPLNKDKNSHFIDQVSQLFTSLDEPNGLIALAKKNGAKALKSIGYYRNTSESLLRNNILAHLGKLPNSVDERRSFIFLAQQNTDKALQALGYYRADISKSINKTDKKDWLLTINIQLNQATTIRNVAINISGSAQEDGAFLALLNEHKMNSGDILDHGKYEKLKSELISLGLERGYFQGKMKHSKIAIHQSYDHADISINYHSGIRYKFGQVNFSDFDLQPKILESLITFNAGDFFTSGELYRFQSQLQQSQFFSRALTIPDKSDLSQSQLPINVSLLKAKSHFFDLGIGYATDTEFRVSASWRTPLINQYGHSQETKIEYSKVNPKGRFSYSIPLAHPLNDILQFQLTLNDDQYGDIASTFVDSKIANLRVYDKWSTQLYIRYLREHWTLSDSSTDVEYILPGISLSKTLRTGPQLDPSWGFSQLYSIEGASESSKSEINLIRAYARWRYVQTLAPNHRIVLRGELGAAFIDDDEKDLLAPSLRFFAGGDQSLRGFTYQSLGSIESVSTTEGTSEKLVVGGTRLATASLEYQYYFTEKLRGILFTDAGNADDKIDFKAVYSLGTGLHYLSPVGPIRLDLGYSLSKENPSWRLHFTVGAEL